MISPSRAPFPSVGDATEGALPPPGAPSTYLQLFRSGLDTRDIARLRGVSEADVYNLLHGQRCADLGRPYQFKMMVR